MPRQSRNELVRPASRIAIENLKYEVANELGIQDYDKVDKGDIPARIHGKIGGNMVRKMIALAQSVMEQNPNIQTGEQLRQINE